MRVWVTATTASSRHLFRIRGISDGSASAGLKSSYGSTFIAEANFIKGWGNPAVAIFDVAQKIDENAQFFYKISLREVTVITVPLNICA